jgi:hypothetical protein
MDAAESKTGKAIIPAIIHKRWHLIAVSIHSVCNSVHLKSILEIHNSIPEQKAPDTKALSDPPVDDIQEA